MAPKILHYWQIVNCSEQNKAELSFYTSEIQEWQNRFGSPSWKVRDQWRMNRWKGVDNDVYIVDKIVGHTDKVDQKQFCEHENRYTWDVHTAQRSKKLYIILWSAIGNNKPNRAIPETEPKGLSERKRWHYSWHENWTGRYESGKHEGNYRRTHRRVWQRSMKRYC